MTREARLQAVEAAMVRRQAAPDMRPITSVEEAITLAIAAQVDDATWNVFAARPATG